MVGIKYIGVSPPVTRRETGMYRLDPTDIDWEAVYVGDWRIDCERLYHKHAVGTNEMPETEYDVNERTCWMCEATCPDSIWFAHRLQQLP